MPAASARELAPPGAAMRCRVAGFARLLRDNGFAVGLAESRDALRILAGPAARSASVCRPALRALFAGRRSDWERFDGLFDAFWLGRGMKQALRTRVDGPAQTSLRQGGKPDIVRGASGSPELAERPGQDDPSADAPPRPSPRAASSTDALGTTDLRHIADPDEVAAAHALAGRLARSMRDRLTRRHRARHHGPRIDLRRTIHRSISQGGTPIELMRRRRKIRPLRLVLLLDVSGSMAPYAPVFLRFMHGVLDAFHEAEAFLFHTRLIHVSAALREKDPARAIDRLSLIAAGLGGGTEIGASLQTFNRQHAKRVIHSRTAVMIVSDGYDVGEPERLATQMATLRRRCRRIVWLNPMAGWRDYAPEARGMRAALPFVDLLAPANTLHSLLALEPYLAKL